MIMSGGRSLDNTNTQKTKKKFYKTKHFRGVFIIIFLLVTAFSANIIVSTLLFNRSTREYREEIICKAAKLAAEQIDADNVDKWLESGADEAYAKTKKVLQSICNNTPYIQYLYVYQIKADGCHVVFDTETMAAELDQYDELPEDSTSPLGDLIDFDESFSEDIPTLLAGGQIDIKESNDKYGWLLTKYEPIKDSSGKCVAYVGADISMIGVNDYNHAFFKWIVVISAVFFVMLFIAAYHYNLRARKADEYDESERRRIQQHILFEQTAEALAGAIDAKDEYTHGHSSRVALYSRKIAETYGLSAEECDTVYYTALLHDVGKIGVPDHIINKKGRLTEDEYAAIKKHPVIGNQILSTISEYPYLSIGAHYHHERYDGKGYPDGLKGDEIPMIARIVAVADAYDAMTSKRSYRDAIPQHIVREELAKGMKTQFDPEFARIMIHMIDLDGEYKMQESIAGSNLTSNNELHCESLYDNCTEGIVITRKKATIRFCSLSDKGFSESEAIPTLIVFDSLDGKVHPGEENNRDLLYYEYAKIRLDGEVQELGARKTEVINRSRKSSERNYREQRYVIDAVRNRDHLLIRTETETNTFEVVLALPDASRYIYISISGEHCEIHGISVDTDTKDTNPDTIPRIAEEISYIKGCPEGDIPNIEVDGPRLATSKGIPIHDSMTLSFHTMSYPTARLIWHCPYFCIFSSSNGLVDGDDYHEYLLLKLNGEHWDSTENVENSIHVDHTKDFNGWGSWLEQNKQGLDCTATLKREGNRIIIQTENRGIVINSVTTILDEVNEVYAALTGDQCAVTDIRINGNE